MSKNKSARLAMITAIMTFVPMGLSREAIKLEKSEKPQEWHLPGLNEKKYIIHDSKADRGLEEDDRKHPIVYNPKKTE